MSSWQRKTEEEEEKEEDLPEPDIRLRFKPIICCICSKYVHQMLVRLWYAGVKALISPKMLVSVACEVIFLFFFLPQVRRKFYIYEWKSMPQYLLLWWRC